MSRTFIRQDTQIKNSDLYDDTVAAGSTLETAGTQIEFDLNGLRSQMKRAIWDDGAGNWYDDIPTINAKKRGIRDLNFDLDELEEQKTLCRVTSLTDIPTDAQARGTITTIAGSLIVDGENFVLSDGVNPAVTFEFDSNASVVNTATLRALVFTGGDSADTIRDTIIAAVNAAPTLNVTASSGGSALVNLINDTGGTAGNVSITETVVNAGFIVSGMSGGATGQNWKLLTVYANQAPTLVAAVALTQDGAVVQFSAFSGAGFNVHELVEIAGPDAINPKNLLEIRDVTTGQKIQSSGRDVFGLLQYESTGVDGVAFNDTVSGGRVKISFVRMNAALDDLEACPIGDIQAKFVNYAYVRRVKFDDLPEDCWLMSATFVDHAATVDVTRKRAYDNQGTTPVELINNATLDVGDGFYWKIRDVLNADLFTITEGSTGGTTTVALGTDVDTFDVSALVNDFDQGIRVDTGGQRINLGETAGLIESTSTNDLRILGAGELYLDDGNQTGSTWTQTAGIKLSDTTAEWNDYETAFGGEVSLLRAIYLSANANQRGTKVYANVTSTTAPDLDVGGVGGGTNLDTQLPNFSGGTFITSYDVFLNGTLLRGGANAAANHDYYPGTSLADGQLKFEFTVKSTGATPDVICVVPYA
jgi:hypothetical protein